MKANKFFAVALAALTLCFVACKKDEPQQESLKITPDVATIAVGATVQLSANLEVTWSSSNAAVATVDDKGLVTGVAAGEVNITAKGVKSNESAVCKVTVTADPQPEELKLDKTELSLEVGASAQLTANMEVTWSSSNEAVATVEAGLVKAIAAGEADITAKAVNSNGVAICKVTVTGGGAQVPEIDVTDNSLADWEALPAEYVVSYACPEDASMLGLKGVAVYATEMYINILVEPNMDDITDLEWVPFHVYLDIDNSDETGGYGDQFTDANADILLETAVFGGGEAISYNPAVFKWWGEVGGSGWEWTDPSVSHDETDFWGAIIGEGQLPVGASQYIDGKFEIQILRELLGTVHPMSDSEFGIGFDIQQNWSSVGILPIGSPTEEDANGYVAKLKVKINK